MSILQPFGWKSKKFDPNHEQKLKNFHVVIWQIFFLHFLKEFSVHILLYKSSLDYNSLLKLFESFKKSNFKTLKKFQISIVIQIGSIKQNVDRKKFKKYLRQKKTVKMKLLIFKIILKKSNIHWQFLSNLAISGPGKCKIWNLGIKISKLTKFELWEMMRSKV